jgi:hypothetical protein
LLEHERIILATDIAGKEEADVEDFFEPGLFVELVNKTYGLSWEHTLTVEKLMDADQGTQRLVKKVEAYFRLLPQQTPEYSHYDPALYLLRTPDLLEGNSDAHAKTLGRFEEAFRSIAKFI